MACCTASAEHTARCSMVAAADLHNHCSCDDKLLNMKAVDDKIAKCGDLSVSADIETV